MCVCNTLISLHPFWKQINVEGVHTPKSQNKTKHKNINKQKQNTFPGNVLLSPEQSKGDWERSAHADIPFYFLYLLIYFYFPVLFNYYNNIYLIWHKRTIHLQINDCLLKHYISQELKADVKNFSE